MESHQYGIYGIYRELIESLTIVGQSEPENLNLLESICSSNKTLVLSFLNSHAVNIAISNRDFFYSLASSDILLRDGIGMELILMASGIDPGRNLNGTDFIPRLLESLQPSRIAVWGTDIIHCRVAARSIEKLGHEVVSIIDGFRDHNTYLNELEASNPRVIVLGMGMPKQELLAKRVCEKAASPVLIINGGAILDFMSHKVPRAPIWVRKARLEWSYRLTREPRRLWSRYLIGNVLFLARALLFLIKYRKPHV